ncbi:MAG: hypothetical protein JWR52_1099 [Marmoricola sp.]|nr:hypothetical protein [Marmoricola sp.]
MTTRALRRRIKQLGATTYAELFAGLDAVARLHCPTTSRTFSGRPLWNDQDLAMGAGTQNRPSVRDLVEVKQFSLDMKSAG